MLFGTIDRRRRRRSTTPCMLADGGKVRRPDAEARAAQLRHVRREARVRARPAARADRVQGREARRADLRGHLAGDRSARISPRPAPSCCWCPTAAPTSSTRTTSASSWSARARSRPACRSPISTASAARTSWCSTARRFVIHPDGERVVQMCRLGRGAAAHRLGARRPTAGAATTRETPRARCLPRGRLPGDDGRRCAIMSSRNGFPGVILGLSGGIDSALSAAVAVDALGAGQGVGRDAAVQIYQSTKASRMRANAPGCSAAAMTSFRSRPAVDALDEMLPEHERARRREYPGAPAHGDADGASPTRAGRCC